MPTYIYGQHPEGGTQVVRISGILSTDGPIGFTGITTGTMIRAFPTAAGTAAVYSSGSPEPRCRLDMVAGTATLTATGNGPAFGTNAAWSKWGAGDITADSVQQAQMPQSAAVIVVTSGTWTFEIAQD